VITKIKAWYSRLNSVLDLWTVSKEIMFYFYNLAICSTTERLEFES
jgi:hypothetical protein